MNQRRMDIFVEIVDVKTGGPVVKCIDIYNTIPTFHDRDALSDDSIDSAISHFATKKACAGEPMNMNDIEYRDSYRCESRLLRHDRVCKSTTPSQCPRRGTHCPAT